MKVVQGFELKEIERKTIEEIGIPSLVLMERAALQVCNYIIKTYEASKNIIVIAGVGNNGADGLCVARMLYIKGRRVSVYIVGNMEKATEEFKCQLHILNKLGVLPVSEIDYSKYDIAVDAIFGIGLKREIEGRFKEVIEQLNNNGDRLEIISVDVPSGIDSDTGRVLGTSVKARVTVTFSCKKAGIILQPGNEYAGDIVVADIGIPESAYDENYRIITYESRDELKLPKREENGNKGTFGKVLIIAGSAGMSGAAFLAGKAAYRMGCGMVRILTDEKNREVLQKMLPEAVLITYESDIDNEKIKESLDWCSCIVAGPGIGKSEISKRLVKEALQSCKKIVLDADALNIISENDELTEYYHTNVIITPHIVEMARLLKVSVREIKEDYLNKALNYSKKYGIVVALKDARTIVCNGVNGRIYINQTGNDGMATAGSGDVLAGVTGSLFATDDEPFNAAVNAVYLHGKAGDIAAEKLGRAGVMASDIADSVNETLL